MPKDNEVDEKVTPDSAAQQVAAYRWRPIGWGVIGDWRVGPPEIGHIVIGDDRYEVEELVPAATVAELRAEVERLRKSNELYSFAMNTAGIDELKRRADAAERRVGELERLRAETYQVVSVLLSDTGQFDSDHGQKILDNLSEARIVHEDVLPWATLTGADPT